MRKVFGLLGFLFVVIWGMLLGSPLSIFIDLPSILFVLGTMIFLSISKYSFKELLSFSDEVVISLINFSLIGGGIGFLVGLIQILQNLSDPNSMGPALALCLLTTFYSMIISAVLLVVKKGAQGKKVGLIALASPIFVMLPMLIVVSSLDLKIT